MAWFHRHKWVEESRHVTPALGFKTFTTDRMSEYMAERIIFGVTVISDRCEICGERKITEALGEARVQ